MRLTKERITQFTAHSRVQLSSNANSAMVIVGWRWKMEQNGLSRTNLTYIGASPWVATFHLHTASHSLQRLWTNKLSGVRVRKQRRRESLINFVPGCRRFLKFCEKLLNVVTSFYVSNSNLTWNFNLFKARILFVWGLRHETRVPSHHFNAFFSLALWAKLLIIHSCLKESFHRGKVPDKWTSERARWESVLNESFLEIN